MGKGRSGGGGGGGAAVVTRDKEKAAAGYNEDTRNLNFVTDHWQSGAIAASIITGAGKAMEQSLVDRGRRGDPDWRGYRANRNPTYNAFRFNGVAKMVARPEWNDLTFRFGREGSPVLYVKGSEARLQEFSRAIKRHRPDENGIDRFPMRVKRDARGDVVYKNAERTAHVSERNPMQGTLRVWWD
jgi:hypothetical protein